MCALEDDDDDDDEEEEEVDDDEEEEVDEDEDEDVCFADETHFIYVVHAGCSHAVFSGWSM